MSEAPQVQIARGIQRQRDAHNLSTAAMIATFFAVVVAGVFALTPLGLVSAGPLTVLTIGALLATRVVGIRVYRWAIRR